MDEKRKDDIKRIANHYGLDAQLNVATEELAELIHAIARFRRYEGEDQTVISILITGMVEEIADVDLMLTQMKHLLNAEQRIECEMNYKIDRQLKRMKKESEAGDEQCGTDRKINP